MRIKREGYFIYVTWGEHELNQSVMVPLPEEAEIPITITLGRGEQDFIDLGELEGTEGFDTMIEMIKGVVQPRPEPKRKDFNELVDEAKSLEEIINEVKKD